VTCGEAASGGVTRGGAASGGVPLAAASYLPRSPVHYEQTVRELV